MKYFLLFLLFVTLWVIVICGYLYLQRRGAEAFAARRHQQEDPSGRCCLEVPCGDGCAREHQRQRDQLAIRYDLVAKELGKIVQAGRELEPAQRLPGLPDE